MDFSEKWGTDVDEAVKLALDDLNLTIDEVEVTVLEEPSRGFLGIGAKLAKVRVEPKVKEETKEIKEENNTKAVAKDKKERKPKNEKKEEKKSFSEDIPRISVSDIPEDLEPVSDHTALDFLKDVTSKMDLDLEITAKANADSLYVDIRGKDSGTIIGKRGQTLDAIQYLTSLVVNKEKEKYVRVIIDAENYRAKRERTLEQLANRLGNKVARTGKMVRLEPMNPYERKVIHATLQSNPDVTTRSEGDEPYRKVIIEAK